MECNSNWKYNEVMQQLKEIRKEYILICNSFTYKQLHERVLYRTKIKRIVYAYPFSEARRNYIWYRLNRGLKGVRE